MTPAAGPLRVALIGRGGPVLDELAAGLRELGHEVSLLEGFTGLLESALSRRGFTTPLAHVPFTVMALLRGDYHIAHAFSPQDAYAALTWRRLRGRPVAFSLIEPIERERLADRRLRLRLLSKALEQSDAVIVHDDDARAAAWRWLALEPQLIAPADGAAYERLYRRLLRQT